METGFSLRDVLNKKTVEQLGSGLKKAYPAFDTPAFQKSILPFGKMPLKERAIKMAEGMRKHLPNSYQSAAKIVLKSLGPENQDKEMKGFESMRFMSHGFFVEKYGLEKSDYELSMKLVYELTKRFTSEGTIRPFIEKYPEATFKRLRKWISDPNVHVRRLVSEGTRPRLPWAGRLNGFVKDPRPVLELLEQLKTDPELYVRRSVANNLNDITKDNPDLTIKTLKAWKKVNNEGTQWIVGHALRSLLKAGNPEALKLMGYGEKPMLKLLGPTLDKQKLKIGQSLNFQIEIDPQASQDLMIDYIMHFTKANGKQSPKVFKWSKKTVVEGKTLKLKKAHSFQDFSTRKHYPGPHAVEIQINGEIMGRAEFEVSR